MMTRFLAAIVSLFLLAGAAQGSAGTMTRGKKLAVDASRDGRLLMDLAGDIWVLPPGGGDARAVLQGDGSAHRPRWSPDGSRFVYTASTAGEQGIWIHDIDGGEARRISENAFFDRYPTWHPSGERITYASDRDGNGFDLWEVDLPTGLHWRLSNRPGDETEPAWSADGRHLVYVHHVDDQWSLILRRQGEPEEVLTTGSARVAGPSWRPDGSLITYWRDGDDGTALDMVILSEPRLLRRYMDGENFVRAPVSWIDKHRLMYTADGVIRERLFNAWSSRTVAFRAKIKTTPTAVVARVHRALPPVEEPQGRLVIHAARLLDGVRPGYRHDMDIVIEGGLIDAVAAHTDHPGVIEIAMGNLAVLPGYVDALARLPAGTTAKTGPVLLAAGVTTIVANHADAELLNALWSGKELPGPRLLPAGDWPVLAISGLADSMTPGLDQVLLSRAARLIGFDDPVARRFSEPPIVDANQTSIVLGSQPNGLPAGIALHAELRALVAARLTPGQALRAAGANAAAALGVDPLLGRIATGAAADLVFVDGDPLVEIGDALNVVAVVRNGRFFSVAGLIDRVADATSVE